MLVYGIFLLFVFSLLALDLGVFHKTQQKVSMKESLAWTLVWVSLAVVFGGVIYWMYSTNFLGVNPINPETLQRVKPGKAMIDFYTGYLIEESLSLDNIFVMALIFSFFRIKERFQHNILFWGILGAVVFRLLMILLGTAIVEQFSWAMYIFGAILLYSAYKMLQESDEDSDFRKNIGVRLLGKIIPIDWDNQEGTYTVVKNGKRMATILLACLVVIEFTDIVFAVDSIPAIFAVTKDPFIVFTSNIFAILGLRSLYFFLSGMLHRFEYLKYSLVFILAFIGVKMLIMELVEIPSWLSLTVIAVALAIGLLISLRKTKTTPATDDEPAVTSEE
jgi:tellurite resistance protein TerC